MHVDGRRRKTLLQLVASSVALNIAPFTHAQTAKPVRIIVPFPAGGGTDVVARIIAEKLRGGYTSSAIVDNRVGASGRLGVEAVKAAEPDGSTLLFTPDFLLTVYPHSFRKLAYNPLTDLGPVAIVTRSQLALAAGPGLPADIKTVSDYINWTKGDPKRAFYATTSAGATPHFVGVMLARDAGVPLAPVHYKGGAPALQDLLGGQIPVSVNPVGELLPYVRSGKIRVLATTGAKRSRYLPDVPTMVESGYRNIVVEAWLGFFAPARTPPETVARIAAAINEAARGPETAQTFDKFGMEAESASTPAAVAAIVKADLDTWGPIVKASGFTADD